MNIYMFLRVILIFLLEKGEVLRINGEKIDEKFGEK